MQYLNRVDDKRCIIIGMYRAPSKQRQRVMRVLVYTLMTAAVLLIVTALVFIMQGYRFNRATSTIEQGGLVQFNSRPSNASITIGTAKLANRTPSKITVNPGNYPVTMQKNGYHTWNKYVDVKAGQVLWLNYAQLIPTSIVTKPVQTFDTISDVLASPNGDRYALLRSPSTPTVDFIDITDTKPRQTSVALAADALPTNLNTLSLASWGSDSDRLLLTAKSNDKTEWLMIDRRDESKTVNLSTRYGIDVSDAVFDPRSNNRVIVRTVSGDIRIIDVPAGTISEVVASSVSSMSMFMDDAILIVQQTSPTTQSVGYVSFSTNKVRQLQEIDTTDKTLVAGATYFGDPYISIASGNKLDVYQLRSLPSSESEASIGMVNLLTTMLPTASSHMSMRTGGRFVLAQYGSGVLTYEKKKKKQTNTRFTTPVTKELRWLDKYHFYLTNGSQLEVLEFDGGNAHPIASVTTAYDATWRDNGKYIYSFTTNKDGRYVLQRSTMIVD